MKKWFFNPFVFIAGTRSLLLGWAIMAITAVICYFSHTHFDGVLDAHNGHISGMSVYFAETSIDWACAAGIFYLAGIIFSKSAIRIVDVAGTMALARWPLIFYSIIGFGINPPPGINEHTEVQVLISSITGTMIVLGLIGFLFVIWMVALMYNAFSVSCNIKGGKSVWVFVCGILAVEIISKIIFHLIH